jgi:hypothetical protein
MNPMGYKIIMIPPMVTNEPNGLQNYHEPTHGSQMNPTGYKIIMIPPMVTNQPKGLQNYHEPTHGYKSTQRVTK